MCEEGGDEMVAGLGSMNDLCSIVDEIGDVKKQVKVSTHDFKVRTGCLSYLHKYTPFWLPCVITPCWMIFCASAVLRENRLVSENIHYCIHQE